MVFELITRIIRPHRPIPAELRGNFLHLFGDIAWYGVLNGSTIAFLSVYATRLGATGDQVGLLGATAAFANLIFTLPIGVLISRHTVSRSVLWSAILNRVFYTIFLVIPVLFLPQIQIQIIIITTLVMSIPLTGVMVGFNALFAEAVPQEWRAYVASIRNAIVSLASMVTTLICGVILDASSLAVGYQIVFGIGLVGSVVSTLHLSRIKSLEGGNALHSEARPMGSSWRMLFRFDVLKTGYLKVIAIFFIFHLFQFLVIPIFPLFVVNKLGYSDQIISLGMSFFQVTTFFISTQVIRISRRANNHIIVGIGMVLMAEFPMFIPFAHQTPIYLLVVALSGVGWGLVSATMFNYLLERMPDDERPAHMSWYNISYNAAVLIGSMGGPLIASIIGYESAFWVFAFGRAMIGIVLLLWG